MDKMAGVQTEDQKIHVTVMAIMTERDLQLDVIDVGPDRDLLLVLGTLVTLQALVLVAAMSQILIMRGVPPAEIAMIVAEVLEAAA